MSYYHKSPKYNDLADLFTDCKERPHTMTKQIYSLIAKSAQIQ